MCPYALRGNGRRAPGHRARSAARVWHGENNGGDDSDAIKRPENERTNIHREEKRVIRERRRVQFRKKEDQVPRIAAPRAEQRIGHEERNQNRAREGVACY